MPTIGGKKIGLKKTVDAALENVDCVNNVFVMKRTGAQVNMTPNRYFRC